MRGVSLTQIIRDQFFSKAPPAVARPGLDILQLAWLVVAAVLGTLYGLGAPKGATIEAVLAANAIFTALSLTMAMFFWPRAIDLKNDPEFALDDSRWHVYRLTTQLFWTVLVGILATGLAVVQLGLPDQLVMTKLVAFAVSVGLSGYQVLLLGQSVFRLYASTFWMKRS